MITQKELGAGPGYMRALSVSAYGLSIWNARLLRAFLFEDMKQSEERFDHLFRRYRRDGVLLHHPYPPHTARRANSKFGGLPTLPANLEWPRISNGIPLHFFAQIDCADIPFRTPLPERGVLFFFGRDDEEQRWHDRDPADNGRVLYTLDGVMAPREVPADLPPIRGDYGGAAIQEFLLEKDVRPNLHIEWPIQPLPIDMWPDALHAMPGEPNPLVISLIEFGLHLLGRTPARPKWQEVEARNRRYREQLQELRADAFAKATGEQWDLEGRSHSNEERAGRAIFEHAETGPEAYPQHWIAIHYAVRARLHRPAYFGSDPLAEDWLQRSNDAGLDEPVSEEDRGAFRTWLANLWPSQFHKLVCMSMVAVIRAWAGDPQRAARVAPHIYDSLRFHFSGASVWGWQYAQMLGHNPSAQHAQPVDNPAICLLNLASDPALGWMFGDMGHCAFWIAPQDLARRDFSKAEGVIWGG